MPNRLKELRKKQKKTLDDIELETGIKRATYSRYENEQSEPKLATWQKLADYFGERIDYVMGTSNIPKSLVDEGIKALDLRSEGRQRISQIILQTVLPDYKNDLIDEDLKDVDPDSYESPKRYLEELFIMVTMLSSVVYAAGALGDEKADENIDVIFEKLSDALTDINERDVYNDVTPESLI